MSDVSPLIAKVEQTYLRQTALPSFRTGDTIRVWVFIKEGDKERSQAFEGVVIRKQHSGIRASFTVRKVSYTVGVERTFPVHTPSIEKIEIVNRGRVRRARLFYLRDLSGKAARIKTESDVRPNTSKAAKK